MEKQNINHYYESWESYDFNTLTSLTSGNIFTYIEKGEKYGVDAYATASTRTFNIELKYRKIPHNKYATILIESDKYANAMNDYLFDGREQLYINFFNDGYMLIWNLNKLRHKPKYSPWRLNSERYGQVCEGRFELMIEDAAIYIITPSGIQLVK